VVLLRDNVNLGIVNDFVDRWPIYFGLARSDHGAW